MDSQDAPAWIGLPAAEMLERSRERVQAQWRQWHDHRGELTADANGAAAQEPPRSVVVFSLARGVGKSSLARELARAMPACRATPCRVCEAGADVPGVLFDLPQPAVVIVPVTPEMSLQQLRAVKRFLRSALERCTATRFVYVLNRAEAGDARQEAKVEEMRSLLGERLAPVSLRNAPVAAQAASAGRTVGEFAPDSGIAADYAALADWLCTL